MLFRSNDTATTEIYTRTYTLSLHDALPITMGCGDTCPVFPGKRYEDWVLEDPAGKGVESVRPIRDEIKGRVETLIGELLAN